MKPLILCIDDEQVVLSNLQQQLKNAFGNSYEYEMAESAEEAFEILDDLDNPVVLVVTDWLMPGIKGDEFLLKFREKHPNTIAIMLSGQADDSAVKKAYDKANLFAFLKKPWNKDELVQVINNAISNLNTK